MSKQIIKYEYRLIPTRLTKINPINFDGIALHHMASRTATINQVTDWHLDGNKWSWNGYSYWIGFDGQIYEVRGIHNQPAGVFGHNNHLISIGCQGDYDAQTEMPQAQFDSIVWLIKHLKGLKELPNLKDINVHSKWVATSCAGRHYPLARIVEEANRVVVKPEVKEEIIIVEDVDHKPDQELIDAVDLLVKYKELNSPDYWLHHAIKDGKVEGEYAGIIIKRLANFIKNVVKIQEEHEMFTRKQFRDIFKS
jgi:hypothetical protein